MLYTFTSKKAGKTSHCSSGLAASQVTQVPGKSDVLGIVAQSSHQLGGCTVCQVLCTESSPIPPVEMWLLAFEGFMHSTLRLWIDLSISDCGERTEFSRIHYSTRIISSFSQVALCLLSW